MTTEQRARRRTTSLVVVGVVALVGLRGIGDVVAYAPAPSSLSFPTFGARLLRPSLSRRASFVGDGGDGGNNDNNKDVEEYMDPEDGDESEEDRAVRERRADGRLPANFRSDDGARDAEFGGDATPPPSSSSWEDEESSSSSSALVASDGSSSSSIEDNPYLRVVSALSPSEIVARFTATASPAVRAAAKRTILGLVGSLPKLAFEVDYVASGARLASLMFQLQMTGYMFKNAEYRLEVDRAFGGDGDAPSLPGTADNDDDVDDDDTVVSSSKDVRGRLRVDLGVVGEAEVDAAAFTSELREEVERLREELRRVRNAKEERAAQLDLVDYVRTLPPREMAKLTNTMSDDVLRAMKGLVGAVMLGIDGGENDENGGEGGGGVTPLTMLEQSGEAIAQLCMWQLVVGYNLRELEVREEMRTLGGAAAVDDEENDDDKDDNDGNDDFSPGLEAGGME